MNSSIALELVLGLFILASGVLIFYSSNRLERWRMNFFSLKLNHEWVGGILFFLGMLIILSVVIATMEPKFLINL